MMRSARLMPPQQVMLNCSSETARSSSKRRNASSRYSASKPITGTPTATRAAMPSMSSASTGDTGSGVHTDKDSGTTEPSEGGIPQRAIVSLLGPVQR
jgi:hypothetical protein